MPPSTISIVLAYQDNVRTIAESIPRDPLIRYSRLAYEQLRDTDEKTVVVHVNPNVDPAPMYYTALVELISAVDTNPSPLSEDPSELLRFYKASLTLGLHEKIRHDFITSKLTNSMVSHKLTPADVKFVWRSFSGVDEHMVKRTLKLLVRQLDKTMQETKAMMEMIADEPGLS